MNTALFPVFLNRFSAVRDCALVQQPPIVVILPSNRHAVSSCELELRVSAVTSLKPWCESGATSSSSPRTATRLVGPSGMALASQILMTMKLVSHVCLRLRKVVIVSVNRIVY